ncbi:hypothetical protein EDD86DRAFT_95558 [Gorgonomyces haynaldii]|nr:hypothetical protein EDD86DRAFT_95558 [Gorgonomyces haynaldii]
MSDKKPRPKSAAPKRPNTAPVRPASAFGQASAILIKEERRASSADTKKPPSFWPERLPPPQKGHEHLRYTSVYPCSSKLLAKKWDDQARKKHIDKIKTMKPAIDNQPPQKPLHLIFGRVKNLNEQGF